MHNSYFDPKTTDLRAYREQAEKRLRTTNLFPSEDTIIHYHAFGEKCTRMVSMKGSYLQHEEYLQHEVYSNDPKAVTMVGAVEDTGVKSTESTDAISIR
jgi:hypothetical protein